MFPEVNNCLAFRLFLLTHYSNVFLRHAFLPHSLETSFPSGLSWQLTSPWALLLTFFPAAEQDPSFLCLNQSSAFLVCSLAWQELSCGLVSWEGCCCLSSCPRISVSTIQVEVLLPQAGSHAFLIYFLVLRKHFQSWLTRKGHTGGNHLRVMHIWKEACSTLTLPSYPYPKWSEPAVLGQSFSDLHNICIDDTG